VKAQTRYAYEKRIKELQDEIILLRQYKAVALIIYDAVQEFAGKEGGINKSWLLGKFRSLLK